VAVLEVESKMDPNLTQHIVINQMLSNLLSNQTSVIIGVVLGGIVTYCFNISLERNKRQFELKKETYFEALDTILKMQRISIKTQQFLRDVTTDPDHTIQSSERELNNAFYETYDRLKLINSKLLICNGSKKIKDIINNFLDDWVENKSNVDKTIKDMEAALKEELVPKWWHFRK
jgi:hypothetical protein